MKRRFTSWYATYPLTVLLSAICYLSGWQFVSGFLAFLGIACAVISYVEAIRPAHQHVITVFSYDGGFLARLDRDQTTDTRGRTPYEAVGALVAWHSERVGVKVVLPSGNLCFYSLDLRITGGLHNA